MPSDFQLLNWLGDLLTGHPGRLFVILALLPLVAFALLGVLGLSKRWRGRNEPGTLDRAAGGVVLGALLVAAGCAGVGLTWYLRDAADLAGDPATMASRWSESFDWIRIGGLRDDPRPALVLSVGYRVDGLAAVLALMVTTVAAIIVLFSTGYMHDELGTVHDHTAHCHRRGRYGRFFWYLALFAFAMLTILIADNLLLVFAGWELVGAASYFLIGFYTERPAAGAAATKAFVVNRVGDFGFLLALAAAWSQYGTLEIAELGRLMAAAPQAEFANTLIGLGLLAGCCGKSAQVPLHTWLPDAMEGPTPVSALIHAATMVAAGVYLAGRCDTLFTPDVRLVVAAVGAATLVLSALIACVQTDIKRVLAFSTGSQLGYMLVALGLGGWAAGQMHLVTHAVFKALLFLSAGAVIHALHHEQDLLKMGGLRRKLPVTAYCMLFGVFAIVGLPPFSGWASKDLILAHALAEVGHHPLVALAPLACVPLTGYYMTRLWLLAFAGEPRDRTLFEHAHEAPAVMTGPLVLLAAASLAVAWGWPVWEPEHGELARVLISAEPQSQERRLSEARHLAHEHHHEAMALGLGGMLLGAGFATFRHRSGSLANGNPPAWTGPARNRFYFDVMYAWLFVRPLREVASASAAFDRRPEGGQRFDFATLDGSLNAVGDAAVNLGNRVADAQTGRLRLYAAALGLTAAAGLATLWGLLR
jgi:NADH-quinone oxidoreductase subunit L